jgi:large subunit ribosomal protein L17
MNKFGQHCTNVRNSGVLRKNLLRSPKKDNLNARRRAARYLYGRNLHYTPRRGESGAIQKHTVLQKLFDDIAPRYENRNGGYTRIIRGELRRGDGAQMAYIQLV